MERIKVEYWQEIPMLIERLKEENSPLLFDWAEYFNPLRTYTTSIRFEDVRIEFVGEYWKVALRLYQSFCVEYNRRLSINTFYWLSLNTTIVNDTLLGNEEFNQFLRANGGFEEAEEFVQYNKLVNLNGEDFEVKYNYRDMEMIQRLGFEVRPNIYQYRSRLGYYLPIGVKVRFNDILEEWIDWEVKGSNRYSLVYTPHLTVLGLEKDSVLRLARYLYQSHGLSDLMVSWVSEPSSSRYRVKIGNTMVQVWDIWREEHELHVITARGLRGISEYELEAFQVHDILMHSEYGSYGIELEGDYYDRLRLPKSKIVGDKIDLGNNKYSFDEQALGSGTPISVNVGDLKIRTPYEYVKSGLYKEVLYPLTEEVAYDVSQIDLDIRVVLGIKPDYQTSKGEEEERLEDMVQVVGVGDNVVREYLLSDYPSVDIAPHVDTLTKDEGFFDGFKRKEVYLTGTFTDVERIPYVLGAEELLDGYRVAYMDNTEIIFSKDEPNLLARAVFMDKATKELKGYIPSLANMLLSLGTDKLELMEWHEEPNNESSEEPSEEPNKIDELLNKWIDALLTGEWQELQYLVRSYPIGVVNREEELVANQEDADLADGYDIFDDIIVL